MLAMSTARRAMLGLAIALGLGLVLTSEGNAQPGFGRGGFGGGGFEKKFEKKFDMEKGFDRKKSDARDERGPGPRTSLESERLQAQVKALSAKLDSLTAQLRELKSKAGKSGSTARFSPEKDKKWGPPAKGMFGKFGPMAKGDKGPPWMRDGARFDRKGPPARFGFERKGPPWAGRDMRGAPWGRGYARSDRRGPTTSARDSRDRGRPSMARGPQRGPQTRGPERRPEPSRASSLESRLDRLIAELETLRREVRSRR
jgi:hypothetical protein